MNYQKATFITSAAKLSQLPEDNGTEVAFAGRSNVGKSSVLNALCQQRGLAKSSKTPGRTQLINLFHLADDKRLVDLPGYGFAKVSREIKKRWEQTLSDYLSQRKCLQGLILIMDCRHPMTDLDQTMLKFCKDVNLNIHILLNKSDKLNKNPRISTLHKISKMVTAEYQHVSVQLFSALKKEGLSELIQTLDNWYED